MALIKEKKRRFTSKIIDWELKYADHVLVLGLGVVCSCVFGGGFLQFSWCLYGNPRNNGNFLCCENYVNYVGISGKIREN